MYNQYFYGLGSAKSCIRELFEYGLQQAAGSRQGKRF